MEEVFWKRNTDFSLLKRNYSNDTYLELSKMRFFVKYFSAREEKKWIRNH